MTPLERAARALAENFKAQSDRLGFVATDAGRYPVLDGCFDMQEAARAVLEAIREPSEDMIRAGEAWQQHSSDVDTLFSEMVKVAIHGPDS